jgi:hypothetical protein
MRVKQITEGDALRGEKCAHCPRRVMPGQVVLYQTLDRAPMTRAVFVVHASCIRKLLEAAPPDADEQAFLTLKTLIHTTREAFPE